MTFDDDRGMARGMELGDAIDAHLPQEGRTKQVLAKLYLTLILLLRVRECQNQCRTTDLLKRLAVDMDGELSGMPRLSASFEELCSSSKIPSETAGDILLCLEEVVSNVIRHGKIAHKAIHIRVEGVLTDNRFEAHVSDDGKPFDPLAHPSPLLDVPLRHRVPGGLGIHLVRNLMDQVTYERREGRNHLTLIKSLVRYKTLRQSY